MKKAMEAGAHIVENPREGNNRFPPGALKPFRKLFHLSGSGIALLYFFYIDKKETALLCLMPLLLFFVAMDLLRLAKPRINDLILKYFHILILEREQKNLFGSTYYMIGSFLSVLLFDKQIAVVSILFLSLGDPLASLVGSGWGRLKVWGKTLEGSLAFFIASLVVGLFFFALPIALSGALAATMAELLPLKLNDNLYIPLVSGVILSFLV
jgi:dolichol kinase